MPVDVTNKRIYVDAENNKGISLIDIMRGLGYYKRDKNGNRNLGMIIRYADINIWAKNKPFVKVNRTTAYDPATAQERFDANYGLSIPKATTITKVKGFYDGKNNGWGRQIPMGTAYTEPLRSRDFDGYWGNARCPFIRLSLPKAAVNTYETSGFKIALPAMAGGEVTEAIGMTEIKDIQDYYFTIQLRHTNPQGAGIYYRTLSAENTVAEMSGGFINFSTYQLPAGEWELIPFLSPIQFTTDNDGNDIPASYSYIPIPMCYVGDMKISDTEFSLIYFEAYKMPYVSIRPVYSIAYNFAVRNNGPDAHTFRNAIVQIRYPGKSFDSTLDQTGGERQVVIPEFTVGSGEAKSVAEVLSGGVTSRWASQEIGQALYDNGTGQEILVRLDNGQPVYRLTIKTSSTDAPEYNPDTDYPTINISE